MRIIIIANGRIDQKPDISPNDFIIAVDGGGRYCLEYDVFPQVIIGDMDSLSGEEIIFLESHGSELIRYPTKKDHTDLELAVGYAVKRGGQELVVYGALGNRWDQTLANILLPTLDSLKNISISLIDGSQVIRYIRPGSTLNLKGTPGDTVSLIPLLGDASGITTTGLEYILNDDTLIYGGTRGISNVLIKESATIDLKSGVLACLVIHINDQASIKHP